MFTTGNWDTILMDINMVRGYAHPHPHPSRRTCQSILTWSQIKLTSHGRGKLSWALPRHPLAFLLTPACVPVRISVSAPAQPVCDGHEATVRIREIEREKSLPRTPIVALSASCSDEEVRAGPPPTIAARIRSSAQQPLTLALALAHHCRFNTG